MCFGTVSLGLTPIASPVGRMELFLLLRPDLQNRKDSSIMDKISYALGLSIGNNFRASGIKGLEIDDFIKGINRRI